MEIRRRRQGATQPGEVSLYFGRLIAWLFATALIGELLWILAYTNWHDNMFSYRLYTIWAVFQLLTTLVIAGLLVDRWHTASDLVPVRQIALVLLVGVVWQFWRAYPVNLRELDHHLSADQAKVWDGLEHGTPGAQFAVKPDSVAWHRRLDNKWLGYLSERVDQVPTDQPVVLVAASGGGSRAAIFAALVLESLARTAIGPKESGEKEAKSERNWTDNIVLISSVSGGSLATAYHVAHKNSSDRSVPAPGVRGQEDGVLLNTSASELQHWGQLHAAELIQAFMEVPQEGFPKEEFADYFKLPKAERAARAEHLRVQLKQLLGERDRLQAQLAGADGGPTANSDDIARELAKRQGPIATLSTAVALLDTMAELASPAPGHWIWNSHAFDEMCVDFMAPLTRGALTPFLDRGDALARFWTSRFHWNNFTNFSGYGDRIDSWNYGDQPAVVFNAVDVGRGSRLAIGFPPLPSDLWDALYEHDATRERPRPLNAPVSLSRAVRMSSNFPYGFRAMAFQSPVPAGPEGTDLAHPGSAWETVHVLDGGVLDNTGLDTIYEIVAALEFHAKTATIRLNQINPYQAGAHTLLSKLRKHGVCLLEIDAGAKPDTELPGYLNPIGGLKEQSQALENAEYSNADRAKQFYLKEICRILNQVLVDDDNPLPPSETSVRDLEEGLPPTAFYYTLQCNHYQPGKGADPAIMTAWALGPKDKGKVVARFLPELGKWADASLQLEKGIRRGLAGVAYARHEALLRGLRDRIAALTQMLLKLGAARADLEDEIRTSGVIPLQRVQALRKQFVVIEQRHDELASAVRRENDASVRRPWDELEQNVHAEDRRLTQLEQGKDAVVRELREEHGKDPALARQYQQRLHHIESGLKAAEEEASRQTGRLKPKSTLDLQETLNRGIRQDRRTFEKSR
jgi:hypothetical protein